MASFIDTLGTLWGAPGKPDMLRTAVGAASTGWGLPGQLGTILPAGSASSPPAADAIGVAPSPIANTAKEDAQPEPSLLARYGRPLLLLAAGTAVVLLVIRMFRKR